MKIKKRLLIRRFRSPLRKFNRSQNRFIFLATAFLVMVFIYNYNPNGPISASSRLLQEYATKVVSTCAKEGYRPACYDREIPKLMDQLSMEQAFQVTAMVQQQDSGYTYCHVLGHELSAREVDKDPSKWKDVVSRCPSGICSNGCIHGGFQERFRAESFTPSQVEALKPDLKTICEDRTTWHPTRLEQASCYHAVGHLHMYITSADVSNSLKLCDEVSVKEDGRNYLDVCYDGVFMQIFQPLEPEDKALIKGKEQTRDTVEAYCDSFPEMPRANCWNESWPLFVQEIKTPTGLAKHCDKLSGKSQDRCYYGLFFIVTAQFNLDSDRMLTFCPGLPKERIGSCFGNAASRMIEVDYHNIGKAIEFCRRAEPNDPEHACYNQIAKESTFNFHPQSKEFLELCRNLPQPWQEQCLAKGTK